MDSVTSSGPYKYSVLPRRNKDVSIQNLLIKVYTLLFEINTKDITYNSITDTTIQLIESMSQILPPTNATPTVPDCTKIGRVSQPKTTFELKWYPKYNGNQ